MWRLRRFAVNFQIKRIMFNRAPARGSIHVSPQAWRECLGRPVPAWMLDRIGRDLAPFAAGLSRARIDEVFAACRRGDRADQYVRVRFSHGRLQWENGDPRNVRFLAIRAGLEHLTEIADLPDLDVVVCLEDSVGAHRPMPPGLGSGPVPIFASASIISAPGLILQPDFTCFSSRCASYAWLTHLLPGALDAARRMPWETRRPVAYWRGATTSIDFDDPHWEETSPRVRLCRLSMQYPDQLDARFSLLTEMAPHHEKYLLEHYSFAPFRICSDGPFKYQVSVEGTTCPYPGLQMRLASGAAVLKQEAASVQWFYDAIRPWVHYIPVRRDLSDLIEAIRWAREHDEEAQAVARRGRAFVEESLSAEPIYLYWLLLLREYGRLLQQG